MSRPDLTPAMRAALLVAARRYFGTTTEGMYLRAGDAFATDLDALASRGLLAFGAFGYRATPAGLDALRAEVST